MKRAQNKRCTSLICVKSLGKVSIKKNENFWSYRLHKLGTLKCCGRTDGRSGPTTRPAFPKAKQVKMKVLEWSKQISHCKSMQIFYDAQGKLTPQSKVGSNLN